ncbi:dihydrolipoyllysine-residue acetyltransferase [Alcanivorax sp. 24]|uniref:dihydrolipoyllysine-residue acetyltransferase n=1 Tax=Alcanivorax sp. 24 TaxID=2545266 RepID=UPI00105ED9B6|nr:dihydrolipoyllysine-residue acetyltransferase [Alcanivorax sp. 24]
MSKETIRVPDVGSSDPVDVIEVTVKEGDTIAPEDTIVVLESDKATVEVPAPKGGKVLGLLVKQGDKVKEGDPLLELDAEAGDGDAEEAGQEQSDRKGAEEAEPEQESNSTDEGADSEDDEQAAGGGSQTVTVPDLGDIEGAEIIEISVQDGDQVEAEQTLVVLESDKASLDIPSPAAGTVARLRVKVGDKVGTGDQLMDLDGAGGGGAKKASGDDGNAAAKDGGDKAVAKAESSPAKSAGQTQKPADQAPARQAEGRSAASASSGQPSAQVHAGPAVRKLARDTGVDLALVEGSGPKDRILKEDVHAYLKRRMEAPAGAGVAAPVDDLPDIDFSEFGPVERVELNKLRKVAARNLHRSWITIPHVTQFDDADITELEAFRKSQNKLLEKEGVKLTMLAFLVKACANALRAFPKFNSSLEKGGEALIQKDYVHIGIAVDTPNGLVVPVLRDADKKGLKEIALEMSELAAKARDRKLTPADMKGACFSISSLGGIGGTAFTPIVNWPEVAILGVSRSDTKPVWDGQAFQPRLTLPLSLSYDHRVIDGADAARFTTYLSSLLGDLRRVLL